MNLFFLSWNFPVKARDAVKRQFIRINDIFPHLDVKTISIHGEGSPIFAVCMSNPSTVCDPRQYLDRNETSVTFYDGCLVDMQGKMAAHRADQLAIHWDTLEDRIEGHYFAAKMDFLIPKLEIKNDFLGFHPVYYRRLGDAWLLSNSVKLLKMISGHRGFDPIGISMFVGLHGWIGGDRTLDSEVFVLPGGQHWIWSEGQKEPLKKTYFSRSRFDSKKPLKIKEVVNQLGDELSSMLSLIEQNYGGTIEAPITAGKDSRLIASVLLKNGIDAQFFTAGAPNSIDSTIGEYIAHQLNLKHNLKIGENGDGIILNNWDAIVKRMLNFTDGMVTLAHISNVANASKEISGLNIHLYGAGGEVGRRLFEDYWFFLFNGFGKNILLKSLKKMTISSSDLILPAARRVCQKHIDSFVDEALNEGFSSADIPSAFNAFEHYRRWGGANYRQIVSYTDVFAPLCTRPFIRSALSLSPIQRYSDVLHFELTRTYAPELFGLPLECKWKPQSKTGSYASLIFSPIYQRMLRTPVLGYLFPSPQTTARPNRETERLNWFEIKLSEIRACCLDDKSSIVWDAIDRNRFEKLTCSDAAVNERKRHFKALYDAVTVLSYCQL